MKRFLKLSGAIASAILAAASLPCPSLAQVSFPIAGTSNSSETAFFVDQLGLGNGGYFRISNPSNIEDAFISITTGTGLAGGFNANNPRSTNPAVRIRTIGRGFALQAIGVNSGLAADFVGLVQMSGFRLDAPTQPGYVLQSDVYGNGRWAAPKGTKGDKGDRGDRGETGPRGVQGNLGPQGSPGPQGNPGAFQFTRIVVTVNGGQTVTLSPESNLVGVQGNGGSGTLILPRADSVPAGKVLILSLETAGSGASIEIALQGNDKIPSLPAGTHDVLVYGAFDPVKRYYSDGSSKWVHW